MEFTIREATTDADIQRLLDVRNSIEAEKMSMAGYRAERAGLFANLELLAEADGIDVGSGSTAWGPISAESRNVFIFAWVRPEHRHHGGGGALLDRLVAFARERGMERMTTWVYADDTDEIGFVERSGLEIDGGGQVGNLDLIVPPRGRGVAAIKGIDVVTMAERMDLEPDLYEIFRLVHSEIPFLASQPVPSFEAWQETGSANAGYLGDLSLLAIEDGRVLGAVEVSDNGDDVIFIGMTMVHPDARRRGIARILKVELERRARAAGKRRIETYNDGTRSEERRVGKG